ncbi:MAG: aminotransferase class IV [Candidatus Methylomirabilales bacterium]
MVKPNRTLCYGEGLFETLRVYPGRRVPLLKAHARRMAEGAAFFGFPFSLEAFERTVAEGVAQMAEGEAGRLRVTLELFGETEPEEASLTITSGPLPVDEATLRDGVTLMQAPFPRCSSSPLVRFKTTAFLENTHARRLARAEGAFDALFLNQRGEVAEASSANCFIIRGRRLITAPEEAGLLPGIARRFLLLVTDEIGLKAEVRPVTLQDLHEADEVLLSNALVEALPVRAIAGIRAAIPAAGWAQSLRAAYRQYIAHWAERG